jgi:hypothetical protein
VKIAVREAVGRQKEPAFRRRVGQAIERDQELLERVRSKRRVSRPRSLHLGHVAAGVGMGQHTRAQLMHNLG